MLNLIKTLLVVILDEAERMAQRTDNKIDDAAVSAARSILLKAFGLED